MSIRLVLAAMILVGAAAWLVSRLVLRFLGHRGSWFQREPVFEIAFLDGGLAGLAGPIPARIREDLLEAARVSGVTGEVHYFAPGDYAFSKEIEPSAEQRLRNALALTFSIPPTPA